MLQPATFQFLKDLSANNNREWFDAHRDAYQAARKDHEGVIAAIMKGMEHLEPALAEQQAKNNVFRIFRDVRFSKDKSPYKANFGAVFSKGGRKYEGAGYYLHIEPGKSFIGGGLWMPLPAHLKALRQEIDYNFEEFRSIVEHKQFKKTFGTVQGEQLKTLPQGYAADNPAIGYLKHKSFTVSAPLTDKEILDKNLEKKVVAVFADMKDFIEFINRSFD